MNTQDLQALSEAIDSGIINMTDVLDKVEDMTKKRILEQHEKFCSIWQASDGRFKTKLPDRNKNNGKKLIAKASRENLEKCIVNWYKDIQKGQENPRTMKALYPAWINYKAEETTPANATKLQWVWDTYYRDSEIVKMDIADIDVVIMKEWFLKTVREHQLTSKKYKEMKSLANMLLDYAIEKRLIGVNVARNVHGISYRKFAESRKKGETEQVYVDDERERLLLQAEKQYEKTGNVAYLAVCMNFFLALRVGEIVALKTTDFSADSVQITRQEIKEYYMDADGRRHRLGYGISPYPKSPAGNRILYLSKSARKYYHMILEHNRCNGLEGEYLFMDRNGERLHDYAINNVLRRVNRQIGTAQKGNHSIRKTCISNMIASKQLTNEEIRKFAGHEDFATTVRYYEFATKSMEERTDAFEAALG